MSFGVQAYVDGVEVISSGDDPCRFLIELSKYTSTGTHIVDVSRQGGDIIWIPYSNYSDGYAFSESSPKVVITKVEAYGDNQIKVTTESGRHNSSSYTQRALVFEWG